jgi:hypothetical protein
METGQQLVPTAKFLWNPLWVRCFIVGILCLHLFLFFNVRERIARGYPDFTIFYTAGKIVRNGDSRHLYDEATESKVQDDLFGKIGSRQGPLPYTHPPFEALIFVPLTFLTFGWAFTAWDLLNLLLLFYMALLLRRHVSVLRLISAWELVIGCLAFFPAFACFLQGQDSILQLCFFTLAYVALKNGSDVSAGGWLALAAFRFQFVVPIVVLLAIWKYARVAAGFLVVSILLGVVSTLLVGWAGLIHYPVYVLQGMRPPIVRDVLPKLMPNLRGLVMGWPSLDATSVSIVITALSSILLFLQAAIQGRKSFGAEEFELNFSLAIAVTLLIAAHTNAHDVCLLILSLVLVANHSFRRLAFQPRRQLSLWLAITPILISPLWIILWLVWGHVNLMAIPLLLWSLAIGKEVSSLNGNHSVASVEA